MGVVEGVGGRGEEEEAITRNGSNHHVCWCMDVTGERNCQKSKGGFRMWCHSRYSDMREREGLSERERVIVCWLVAESH